MIAIAVALLGAVSCTPCVGGALSGSSEESALLSGLDLGAFGEDENDDRLDGFLMRHGR